MKIIVLLSLLTAVPAWGETAPKCKENFAPVGCKDVDFDSPATETTTRSGCFWSETQKRKVMYSVTFPKGYRAGSQCKTPYPYAIYLHGRDGDHMQFKEAGGERELNNYLAKKSGPPFLVVAPAQPEHSYWKDGTAKGKRFNNATMVSEDLVKHMEEQACVAKGGRENRCLMGFSMGGHGTQYLRMRNPEVFKYAYAISPIFRGQEGLDDCDKPAYGTGADFNRQDPVFLFRSRAQREGKKVCCHFRAEIAADDGFITDPNWPQTRTAFKDLEQICPGKIKIEGTGGHGGEFLTSAFGRAFQFCGDAFKGKPMDASECDEVSVGGGASAPVRFTR